VEGWASQLKDQWNLATMTGVRLGGIDPSILRELSGVYKPFPKALKELVSNAFDADADHVQITIGDDFSSVTVIDDGEGMTPFEFRNDFTRIGGGSRRWLGERTRKGRLRVGSKGIGFLALARYLMDEVLLLRDPRASSRRSQADARLSSVQQSDVLQSMSEAQPAKALLSARQKS
jgi:hypothetical protein